jgi:DNA-directed RNA polymerase I subunit RPA2
MLIMQKQNFPICFSRGGYSNKGPGFSPHAVQMRCVREDFYARTITLHYLLDGSIVLRLLYQKQEFLLPLLVVLRALCELSDLEIRNLILRGREDRADLADRIGVMLADSHSRGLASRSACLEYIGLNFRFVLRVSEKTTNYQAGQVFLA